MQKKTTKAKSKKRGVLKRNRIQVIKAEGVGPRDFENIARACAPCEDGVFEPSQYEGWREY